MRDPDINISLSRVFNKTFVSYSIEELNTLSSSKLTDLFVNISSLVTNLYPNSFSVGPQTFCTT